MQCHIFQRTSRHILWEWVHLPIYLEAVDRGIDFFDCVYPSRNGRHGHVYTKFGKINLFNAKYETDTAPIEEGCGCPCCQNYSRAYVRHLLKAKEMLGMRLCVLHNLYYLQPSHGQTSELRLKKEDMQAFKEEGIDTR